MLPVLLMLLAPQAETLPSIPASAPALDPSKPRPEGNIASWFSNDDYPTQALREQASGPVTFMVDVDAAGAPVKCTVTTGTGSPSLDDGTCAIVMQKGRFIAGRNPAGQAIAGQFTSRVRWQMPDTLKPGVLMTISGADNSVCTFELEGKTRHLNPDMCRGLAFALVKGGRPLDKPVFIEIPDVPGAVLPEGE
jgi:hypothetical protein